MPKIIKVTIIVINRNNIANNNKYTLKHNETVSDLHNDGHHLVNNLCNDLEAVCIIMSHNQRSHECEYRHEMVQQVLL